MDCSKARDGLWPPEEPKLVGDEIAAARAHVDACEACAAYLALDRALLDVYERSRDVKAPAAVREQVFEALARERRGLASRVGLRVGPGRWHVVWAAVLVAGMATTALVAVRASVDVVPGPTEGPAIFAEDYLRRAVGQDHVETSDHGEVRRFLRRELGISAAPLRVAGLELARAEICLLEGRRAALIVYRHGASQLSHYIVPSESGRQRAPTLTRSGASGSAFSDMPVVTWATTATEQALVGELEPLQLLELARRSVGLVEGR